MCQHSEINNLVGTCFQKQSNFWNKSFESKCTEYKIFKLKYENGNKIR